MAERNASSHPAYGSYIQLNTFDDKKEKTPVQITEENKRFICTRRDIIIVVIVFVSAFIVITTSLAIGLPKIKEKQLRYLDTSLPVSSSLLKSYDNAVVLTDGEPCAAIGKDVLLADGNAVDAAIATLFCNGVVNPQSMGLGGGFLMVVYLKESGESKVIDARETAPAAATKNMYNGNTTLAQEGGLSIGVPGELKGYWEAHKLYGKLKWPQLVEPSVKICVDGFRVTSHLAEKLKLNEKKILTDSSMREEFFNNDTNEVYKEGDILKRPVLGETLKKIAEGGADVLYNGNLTENFVQDIKNCGGIINETDLEKYQPRIKTPIKVSLRDGSIKTLHTVPPPGSGLILSLILNILDGYNITAVAMEDVDEAVLMYHRIIEAFKFSFAHRTQLEDEDFANITQLIADLTSREYAETIRQKISDKKTYPPEHYKPLMETVDDHGTAQVSVLAPNGDAVSVTSTVNTYFGSLCRSASTGIILNNGMDDFSSPNITNFFGIPPSPKNYIEPGKRPMSSMCPSILVDSEGAVRMVVGAAGGTRIITASAYSMIRIMWLGEDVKKATDAPRIHHQLFPNYIQYEEDFPKIYLDKLKKYDHSTKAETEDSIVLNIVKENGKIEANVDHRKGGSVDGY